MLELALRSPARRSNVPTGLVALLLVLAAACQKEDVPLAGLPCEAGACASGFVCHPETQRCVEPIPVGCDGAGTCPTSVSTGDACPSAGSFLPCSPSARGCELGCRTCGADHTWSACSTPPSPDCDGVDAGSPACACVPTGPELCNGKDDDCDGAVDEFDGAASLQAACALAHPSAVGVAEWACTSGACDVLTCAAPRGDSDNQAANGCEVACIPTGVESCNGLDDDCNGTTDDVAAPALAADCTSRHAGASNVTTWGCATGLCTITACVPGTTNANTSVADGCEAGCAPTVPPTEVCDGKDNDCNGSVDVGASDCTTFYRDEDGDGAGRTNDTVCSCAPSAPHTATVGGDCDDLTTGCGAACRPGNSNADTCDGKDNDCDGNEGEDDPALGQACDGADVDSCNDDTRICSNGALACTTGTDEPESESAANCADSIDNDCDGLVDCQDAGCKGNAACSTCADVDGDGATNCDATGSTATPADCDDTVRTCVADCTTNSDAASEPQPVVDCVERFCGTDPLIGADRCWLVHTQDELIDAILAANTTSGRQRLLVNASFSVNKTTPHAYDDAGLELRARAGLTVTTSFNAPLLTLASDANVLEDLVIAKTAGSLPRVVVVTGDDNVLRRVRLTSSVTDDQYAAGGAVDLLGANALLEDVSIVKTGTAQTSTALRVLGPGAVVRRLTHQTGTGRVMQNALVFAGDDAVIEDVTQTIGYRLGDTGIIIAGVLLAGQDITAARITQSLTDGSNGYVNGAALQTSGARITVTDVVQTFARDVYRSAISLGGVDILLSGATVTLAAAGTLRDQSAALEVTGQRVQVTDFTATLNGPLEGFGVRIWNGADDGVFERLDVSASHTTTGAYGAALFAVSSGMHVLTDLTGLTKQYLVQSYTYGNPDYEPGAGLWIDSPGNVITNVDLTFQKSQGSTWRGVHLDDAAQGTQLTNVALDFDQNGGASLGGLEIDPGAVGSVVRDVTINFDGTCGHGVRQAGTSSLLEDVTITFNADVDTGGRAAGLQMDGVFATARNISISSIADLTAGIDIRGSNNLVDGCSVVDADLADNEYIVEGVRVRTQSSVANMGDDNTVRGCTLRGMRYRGIIVANPGSGSGSSCSDSTAEKAERNAFIGNVITGTLGLSGADNYAAGILLCDALDTRVVGNVITHNAVDGIKLVDCRPASPDPSRITYIDHNTIAYNVQSAGMPVANAIEWYTTPSDNACVRNNLFAGNNGDVIHYNTGATTSTFSSDAACTGPLTDAKWGNYSAIGELRCSPGCSPVSFCQCLTMGEATFFEFYTAPSSALFASTLAADAAYMCLAPSVTTAQNLIDKGDALGPASDTDPLYSVYDRNGAAPGVAVDVAGVTGTGPDIGGRESGAGACP